MPKNDIGSSLEHAYFIPAINHISSMFVKMYRYELEACDFPRWKQIIDVADRIYQTYGGGYTKRLVQRDGDYCTIVELDYYTSKQSYLTTMKHVQDDVKIPALFQDFLKILRDQRYTNEEFETL